MQYLTVEQAITTPGLRLVLSAGVPGPWGESAKAMLAYKGVAFTPVAQEGGGENSALLEWTGQTSAPVVVLEGQPPVCHWLDLLMLTETLAPDSPLLPQDAAERVQAIGLAALIAGVDGFGWNRRLQMLAPMMALATPPEQIVRLATKYGWSDTANAQATDKLITICRELDRQLQQQRSLGRDYLVGEQVTAADFYWANFAGMVKPLGPEDNPMPDYMRVTYETCEADMAAAVTDRLLAHRDMMYARHIALPLDF